VRIGVAHLLLNAALFLFGGCLVGRRFIQFLTALFESRNLSGLFVLAIRNTIVQAAFLLAHHRYGQFSLFLLRRSSSGSRSLVFLVCVCFRCFNFVQLRKQTRQGRTLNATAPKAVNKTRGTSWVVWNVSTISSTFSDQRGVESPPTTEAVTHGIFILHQRSSKVPMMWATLRTKERLQVRMDGTETCNWRYDTRGIHETARELDLWLTFLRISRASGIFLATWRASTSSRYAGM